MKNRQVNIASLLYITLLRFKLFVVHRINLLRSERMGEVCYVLTEGTEEGPLLVWSLRVIVSIKLINGFVYLLSWMQKFSDLVVKFQQVQNRLTQRKFSRSARGTTTNND